MTNDAIIPENELPVWMLRAQRGTDWGVVLVLVTCLLLGWQFITQPSLPRIHQHESYVLRAGDYQDAFLESRLYPRWAPHALNGYGAPVYNYYPPAAPYSTALISVLFTNDIVLAIKIVYVLCFCLAGASIYAFVLKWSNATAGLIAAIAYVYSPYVGLTSSQVIGDLNLVIAIALLPCLLWSWQRLLSTKGELDSLWLSLIIAGLILSHPAYALIGLGLIIAMSIWEQLLGQMKIPVIKLLTPILLGIGLCSFFWIPALLERHIIQWLSVPDQQAAWQLQLISIFQPHEQVDSGILQPTPHFTLGITLPLFTIMSLILIIFKRQYSNLSFSFLLIGITILGFATQVFPSQVWLLGIITLCFSIGISSLPANLASILLIELRLIAAIILALLLITAIPIWLGIAPNTIIGERTIASHIFYEQRGHGVAGLPIGADVPITLPSTTSPNRFLIIGYQENNLDRLSPNQPTARSQTSNLFTGTHRYEYLVRTREAIQLEFLTAWFPGWQAEIGNNPITITPDPETNLLTVYVPRTEQASLTISLGFTDVRLGAWIIAWCSLGIMTSLTFARLRRTQNDEFMSLKLLSAQDTRLLVVVLISFFGINFLLANEQIPVSLREKQNYKLEEITTLGTRTDIGIEFLGYRFDQLTFQQGQQLKLRTYWDTNRILTENYNLQLSLQDVTNGTTVLITETGMIGGYPTRGWQRNIYVEDVREVMLPENIPEGNYLLAVEVFNCTPECISRLNFFDGDGRDIGLIYTLPERLTIVD